MYYIDMLIGAMLVNSVGHGVIGLWKWRMICAFGLGYNQNIVYGFLFLLASIGLYSYAYGIETIVSNGMYVGWIAVALLYFTTGRFWYTLFKK